jgi:hypothetical protein
MEKNVGVIDRMLRIYVGLLLLAQLTCEGPVKWFGLAGIVLIVTGMAGWCGLYRLLRIDTLDEVSKIGRTA